jgi:hypothetical protein
MTNLARLFEGISENSLNLQQSLKRGFVRTLNFDIFSQAGDGGKSYFFFITCTENHYAVLLFSGVMAEPAKNFE